MLDVRRLQAGADQGRTPSRQSTVLIGDGTSDRKAALLADVVFAKDELATWCADNAVRYVRFGCLDDVRRTLLTEDAA